uniref:Thymidine kinase n=1 Tax=uncultured bacterium W5-102b TaxID=1130996 RepID=H9BWJ2_9BACT|nr:thymidine kinase [uncultured bacterium W5-102b]
MQVVPARGGWIEVVCGSMFSGKSEELMRRLRRAQIARLKVAVYKPALDNRYDDTAVVSHNGNRIDAKPVETASDILRMAGNSDVVGIDEAQFFDEHIVEVSLRLADAGKRVVLACLDMDFKGEPFGPVPPLLTVAEFVTKLQAICQQCGGPATRTQRLIEGMPASADEPVVKVGAMESYEPRCRNCHDVPVAYPEQHLDDAEATDGNALAGIDSHGPVSGHLGRFAV